jgi:hypothetical protein
MFILPKKYASVQDVRISDVLAAFPLTKVDREHDYIFRFETVLYQNKRRVNVWLDCGANLDVSVPNLDGVIRMKVLKLPKGVKAKQPIQLPKPKPMKQQ